MAPRRGSGLETVNKLIAGYGSLSVPTLTEPLADDFVHRVLPASLDMPARDKESFAQHATGVFGIFEKFQMIPVSTCEDRETGMVVVHAHMRGTMKQGATEWRNECIMMIRLSADGLKVVEITEFVDSAKAMQMRQQHAPEVFKAGGDNRNNNSNPTAIRRAANLLPSVKQIALICILYQLMLIVASRISDSVQR